MSEVVQLSRRDSIGVISVDNPPVNALGHAVRKGLTDRITEAMQDDALKAVVIIGKGRLFLAGADIREFGKPPEPPILPDVIKTLETSAKPVVAAIHGNALGGGLEVALGCHFRVALGSANCGFPEVKLGLLPGAGGTQRAPRVMGVKPALELIVSGDPISAPAPPRRPAGCPAPRVCRARAGRILPATGVPQSSAGSRFPSPMRWSLDEGVKIAATHRKNRIAKRHLACRKSH